MALVPGGRVTDLPTFPVCLPGLYLLPCAQAGFSFIT